MAGSVRRLLLVPTDGVRHFETILRIRCGISFSLVLGDERNQDDEEEEGEEEKTTNEMKEKALAMRATSQ